MKGMVLEDLTDTMESVLSNFNETEISEAGVRPYSKWIDTLVSKFSNVSSQALASSR